MLVQKKQRLWQLIPLLLFFYTNLAALSEKIEIKNLSNGLKVIFIRDPGSSAVCTALYFRNGVRHNPPDPYGSAYLYQYMMFYGNEVVSPYEQVFFVNRTGGLISGKVNYDFSFFYSIVPENEILNILRFENQRLKSLRLRDDDIEEQKRAALERINNSLKQSITQRAVFWLQENVLEGTGYQQQLFGKTDEFSRLLPEQIRKIYPKFFCKDNIFLIICGNFVVSEVERIIDRDFKAINFSNNTNNYSSEPFKLRENFLQKNWVNPNSNIFYSYYAYKVPSFFSRDYLMLSFIKNFLADNRSGRLQKMFAVNNIKAEAEISLSEFFGSNMFLIRISAQKQSDLEIARYILNKELENLQMNLLTFNEVKFIKKILLYDFWKRWQNLEERALLIASCLNYRDNFSYLDSFPDQINGITAYDILRIARKYFTRNNLVILNIYGI